MVNNGKSCLSMHKVSLKGTNDPKKALISFLKCHEIKLHKNEWLLSVQPNQWIMRSNNNFDDKKIRVCI